MKTLKAIEQRLNDCVMMRRELEVQYRIFLEKHQTQMRMVSDTESMLENLKKIELDELQKQKDAISLPGGLED